MLKSSEIFPTPSSSMSKLEPLDITPKAPFPTSKSHANLPKPTLQKPYHSISSNKVKIHPFSLSPKNSQYNKSKQSFDQSGDRSENK